MINKTLAHYSVIEKLGAGGMGEVYRAEDTKLGRQVAIKVLPSTFPDDKERMARFEREARTLAALNHPNIASIYGLDESEGIRFLAMELVEGQSLDLKLKDGALPVDEALGICLQIAEGIEAAHEKGIIHRDLKPANIMVNSDGKVKILDFGLAKALAEGETGPVLMDSPTLTAQMTQPGIILGTAPYMSPEQAKGKPVDTKTDIWAFGCILYECLTGERAFPGESVSETVASILKEEPDWNILPGSVPSRILELLERCLVKEPRNRLQHVGDGRIILADSLQAQLDPSAIETEGSQPRQKLLVRDLILGALIILIPLAYWIGKVTKKNAMKTAAQEESFIFTTIDLSDEPPLALDSRSSVGIDSPLIDLSPDGKTLVYVGETENGSQLFVRDLAALEVRPLEGSEGAVHPFFSPDGQSVGFLTNDKVKIIGINGDAPRTICNATTPVIATWNSDGFIYFGDVEGTVLARVSDKGGESEEIVKGRRHLRFGKVLPDGRHVFASYNKSAAMSGDFAQICIVSIPGGEMKLILDNGYDARFILPNHLIYGRGGDLYAIQFDVEALEVRGRPWRITSEIRMNPVFEYVQVATSQNDIIAFVPGGSSDIGKLAIVNRQNRTEFLPLADASYGQVDISPNGRHIAVHVMDVRDYILVYELQSQRIIAKFEGTETHYLQPLWSRLGDKLAFTALATTGMNEILIQSINSGQNPEVIERTEKFIYTQTWGPDDKNILVSDWPVTERLYLPLPGSEPSPLPKGFHFDGKSSTFIDLDSRGKWVVVYTGKGIKVRSIDGEEEHQISPDFGIEPRWCDTCDELYYRDGNRFYSVRVRFEPEFHWEKSELIWVVAGFIDTAGQSFDVFPDGQKLLVVKRERELPRDRIHIIQNWVLKTENGLSNN